MTKREELVSRLRNLNPTEEDKKHYDACAVKRGEFLKIFPKETLLDVLTLDSYCLGNGNENALCRWLVNYERWGGGRMNCPSNYLAVWYDKAGVLKFDKKIMQYRSEHPNKSQDEIIKERIFRPLLSFIESKGADISIQNYTQYRLDALLQILNLYYYDEFVDINNNKWIKCIFDEFNLEAEDSIIAKSRAIKLFIDGLIQEIGNSNLTSSAVSSEILDMLKLSEDEVVKKSDKITDREENSFEELSGNRVDPCFWKLSIDGLTEAERKECEDNNVITLPKAAWEEALAGSRMKQGLFFEYGIRKGDFVYICSRGIVQRLVEVVEDINTAQRSWKCKLIASASNTDCTGEQMWMPDQSSTFLRVPSDELEIFSKNLLDPCFGKRVEELRRSTFVEPRHWWMNARDNEWKHAFNETLKEMKSGVERTYSVFANSGLRKMQEAFHGCREGDLIIGYSSSDDCIYSILCCSWCCSPYANSQHQNDELYFKKLVNFKNPIKKDELRSKLQLGVWNVQGNLKQVSLFPLTAQQYCAFKKLAEELNPDVKLPMSGMDATGASGNGQIKWADPIIGRTRNLIRFGAPGTGKSFQLEEDRKKYFDGDYERVTFYPTYSYAQFVGTYKPVMKDVEDKEEISYEFVPGPFLRVLVKALNEPEKNRCLIIEEINRANAAAVFGDVFQLLDRNSKGVSEYAITASEDVKKFLNSDKGLNEKGKKALLSLRDENDTALGADSMSLKIPSNMYIWATMNSADQGVFPMDTAFKRRWEFEYIGINGGEREVKDWLVVDDDMAYKWIKDGNNKWNNIRKFINRLLTMSKVNEDKLMGPFFVKSEDSGAEKVVSAQQFESKVLMYLWEDAARMCRAKLFKEVNTYSELITKWRADGPQMFANIMRENPFSADTYLKGFCNELGIDLNVSE